MAAGLNKTASASTDELVTTAFSLAKSHSIITMHQPQHFEKRSFRCNVDSRPNSLCYKKRCNIYTKKRIVIRIQRINTSNKNMISYRTTHTLVQSV